MHMGATPQAKLGGVDRQSTAKNVDLVCGLVCCVLMCSVCCVLCHMHAGGASSWMSSSGAGVLSKQQVTGHGQQSLRSSTKSGSRWGISQHPTAPHRPQPCACSWPSMHLMCAVVNACAVYVMLPSSLTSASLSALLPGALPSGGGDSSTGVCCRGHCSSSLPVAACQAGGPHCLHHCLPVTADRTGGGAGGKAAGAGSTGWWCSV